MCDGVRSLKDLLEKKNYWLHLIYSIGIKYENKQWIGAAALTVSTPVKQTKDEKLNNGRNSQAASIVY